jgi:hypothetical protein
MCHEGVHDHWQPAPIFLNRREQRSQRGRIPGERPPASLAGLTKLIAKSAKVRKCESAKVRNAGGWVVPDVFSLSFFRPFAIKTERDWVEVGRRSPHLFFLLRVSAVTPLAAPLKNQHRVAVTVETVLLLDRFGIRTANQPVAAKRAD